MEEGKVKELETKLREMFELSERSRNKKGQRKIQPVANFVIRRRKGQEDKRIFLNNRS